MPDFDHIGARQIWKKKGRGFVMLPEVAPTWDSYMTKNNQNLSKQKKVTVSKSVNLEVTPLIVKMTVCNSPTLLTPRKEISNI